MKRKKLTALVIAACMLVLSACGGTEQKNQATEEVMTEENQGDAGSFEQFSVDETNDPSRDGQENKPKVSIKLIDDKRADFSFDMTSFPDFDFGEDTMFMFYLPGEYEIEWYGVRNGFVDGGESVQDPEIAIIFHPEYAGLGEQNIEKNGSDLVIHADLSYKDEYQTYVKDFSFANLSGACRLEYNPPEHLQGDDWFTHEYYYEWADIINTDSFSSLADKDRSKELVGIWATDEAEAVKEINGEWRGFMVRDFYVFYPDGTWSWVSITDSRDDQGYHSVDDNFADWYAGNKPTSDHTYYFDGETMIFTPEDDYNDRNRTDATLEGETLSLHTDWGKYLDEQNQQSGEYHYYSEL